MFLFRLHHVSFNTSVPSRIALQGESSSGLKEHGLVSRGGLLLQCVSMICTLGLQTYVHAYFWCDSPLVLDHTMNVTSESTPLISQEVLAMLSWWWFGIVLDNDCCLH